jgi:hypothetical protein
MPCPILNKGLLGVNGSAEAVVMSDCFALSNRPAAESDTT